MRKGEQAAALWSFHAGGEARHETQLLKSVVCDDGCLGEVLKAQKRGSMSGKPHKTRTFALLLKGCCVRKEARGIHPEGKATTLKTVKSLV